MAKLEYFPGMKWECTAHYPNIGDQVSAVLDTETQRDLFVRKHFAKGANVNVDRISWQVLRSGWAFYDHREKKR